MFDVHDGISDHFLVAEDLSKLACFVEYSFEGKFLNMRTLHLVFRKVPRPLLYIILIGITVSIPFILLSYIYSDNNQGEGLSQNDNNVANQAKGLPADAVIMVPELISHMTWKMSENVLDYGCGRGAVGYHLINPTVRKYHSHQYAVEYVSTNVEKAIQNYSDPSITYAVGNLLEGKKNFPFKSVKFDKVFAIYVFHLIPDLEKFLGQLKDIMQPGGQLGFTTLTENNFAFHMNMAISKMPKWRYYMRHYESKYHPTWSRAISQAGSDGVEVMRKLLERAGYRVVHLRIAHQTFYSWSVNELLDSWFWLAPVFEDIPVSMIPDLQRDMREKFTEITGFNLDATHFPLQNEYIVGVVEKI